MPSLHYFYDDQEVLCHVSGSRYTVPRKGEKVQTAFRGAVYVVVRIWHYPEMNGVRIDLALNDGSVIYDDVDIWGSIRVPDHPKEMKRYIEFNKAVDRLENAGDLNESDD